jgi:hypothetical protein
MVTGKSDAAYRARSSGAKALPAPLAPDAAV